MDLERLRNELGTLLVRALLAESRVAQLEAENAKLKEEKDGVPVGAVGDREGR